MNAIAGLADYSNPASLGYRLRARRKHKIADMIERIFTDKGGVSIVDLGGRPSYWNIFGEDFLQARNCHVTLVNTESYEPSGSPTFTDYVGDACSLPYEDNEFDMVHSNSTIEHVGLWPKMEAFAKEVRRLAPSYYVQTPYYWCPIDPHAIFPFHHWLPLNMRTKLMIHVKLGKYPKAMDIGHATAISHSTIMLDRAQMKHLFHDADVRFEWFGPMPKSLLAIRTDN